MSERYLLDLSKKAGSFLERLPPKQYKQIARALFKLMADPQPHDSKELKGYTYRRVDTGEYRIIYRIDDEVIVVQLIGKRNDDEVYKALKRIN